MHCSDHVTTWSDVIGKTQACVFAGSIFSSVRPAAQWLWQRRLLQPRRVSEWSTLCSLVSLLPYFATSSYHLCRMHALVCDWCFIYAPEIDDLCRTCAPVIDDLCRTCAPALCDLCRTCAPVMCDLCRTYAPALCDLCRTYAPGCLSRGVNCCIVCDVGIPASVDLGLTCIVFNFSTLHQLRRNSSLR